MRRLGAAITIIRKELAAYFNSSIAYIFLFVFVALLGFLFMSQFFLVSRADMRIFFQFLPLILCVFLPAVTMRLWAEEKQGGTYELLLTFPMQAHELVIGKFAASFIFYLAALAATLPIPIMLLVIGRPDFGTIIGGYLGAAFLGAFFLAVGLFISGLCKDQIIAFIVAMLSCFAFFLLGTEFIASTIDGWLPGLGGLLMNHVGVSRHFASFQKGVFDLHDVLYFVLGTSLVLILNGFWIEGRMRPRQTRIFVIASTVVAAIFVLGNWLISDLPLGRFDLTQGRLYTVSPASKKILDGLKAPVTVKYYVSPADKMPTGYKTLERDVLDKLDEFRLISNGKFRYKVFHMEAANIAQAPSKEGKESLETSLQRKGVEPFQVQSIEADELGLRLVYSAMAVAYKEKPEEILPRIIPSNLNELEYLLLSTIYRMTLARAPRVALAAPFTETPIDPSMRTLLKQLGRAVPEQQVDDSYRLIPPLLEYEGYQVTRINLTDTPPIPSGTNTLLLLEPKELTPLKQQAISKFLVEGGSVLIAAQNYKFDYTTSRFGEISVIPRPQSPNVNALLGAWGVGLDDRVLLDSSQDVISVGGGMRLGPFAVNLPLKLPVHIRVNPESMNQKLSTTSRISPILYLWGSALKLDRSAIEARGLTAHVLMSSSTESWLIPSARIGEISPTAHPGRGDKLGPFPLAVLLEGNFSDAFADKRTEPLHPAPGKLLVIGAFTPFQEQLIGSGGHQHFLLNAIDALSLGEDLIQIRAKQPVDRSIGHVSSGAKSWWRFFVSCLIPLLIAGVGWARMMLRRRIKRQYMQLIEASA